MCPLISAPNRGYADYQRVGNYDSGILWSVDTGSINVGISSPLLDVGRYAYLGGTIAGLLNQSQVSIFWYADAAATIQVGERFIQLHGQILQPAQIRLPNLGPFVRINCNITGGANQDVQANVFGTNRVHPLEFIPVNPLVIDQQNVAIAAGVTANLYPFDYYAGPCRLWMLVSQTSQWQLQALSSAGVWELFDQQQGFAAFANVEQTLITPPGAWRLAVQNTSGTAGNYWAVVTPSTTGAT